MARYIVIPIFALLSILLWMIYFIIRKEKICSWKLRLYGQEVRRRSKLDYKLGTEFRNRI